MRLGILQCSVLAAAVAVVCTRALHRFLPASRGRTDWRCLNAIDVERRIGAANLLPRFCKFCAIELDGWMAFFFKLFLIAFFRVFERVASEVCR